MDEELWDGLKDLQIGEQSGIGVSGWEVDGPGSLLSYVAILDFMLLEQPIIHPKCIHNENLSCSLPMSVHVMSIFGVGVGHYSCVAVCKVTLVYL